MTYLKRILYVAMAKGALCLLLFSSFGNYNACKFANQNTGLVVEQTGLALGATTLQMAKYHGFKALKSVSKTKENFEDCACEEAMRSFTIAEENLKEAVKANTLADAKAFLTIAMNSSKISRAELDAFEKINRSAYSDELLVMNTKGTISEQGGIIVPESDKARLKIEDSLERFQTSLDQVVAYVDCEDAFNFISKIVTKSDAELAKETLSEAQRYYHSEIKKIAYEGLLELNTCKTK
ncbi:hypothetical protein ABV409_12085 [Flagellimonas sp. DF-77]|uniref:hypothetical protein n=1 Tax=Flagellimonas algarum TaxID=3230298 RepID=UPI003394CB56